MLKFKPICDLIISVLYTGAFLFFTANLSVNGSTFTAIDLGLTIVGGVLWGIVVLHNLYRNTRMCYQEHTKQLDNDEHAIESTKQLDNHDFVKKFTHWRSTEAALKSSLHIGAATFFFADDLINPKLSSPVIISRLCGTGWWFTGAATSLFLSRQLLWKLEKNPGQLIKPLGIHPSAYNVIIECEYLLAAIFYAYSIWSDNKILPLKVVSNILWLSAGLHETIRASKELIQPALEANKLSEKRTVEITELEQSQTNLNTISIMIDNQELAVSEQNNIKWLAH